MEFWLWLKLSALPLPPSNLTLGAKSVSHLLEKGYGQAIAQLSVYG